MLKQRGTEEKITLNVLLHGEDEEEGEVSCDFRKLKIQVIPASQPFSKNLVITISNQEENHRW